MSVEKALVARAGPYMLAARVRNIIEEEACKGCGPQIVPFPVCLEPPFRPISEASELLRENGASGFVRSTAPSPLNLVRMELWPSPEEEFSWLHAELFLKQLQSVSRRVGFEIVGNREGIQMRFLLHRDDLPVIRTAFRAQFERCELSLEMDDPLSRLPAPGWQDCRFIDCFPPSPYSHLLTRPEENRVSTFRSLIAALMEMEPPALGLYQALFKPTRPEHDWHRNVRIMLDLEYCLKLLGTGQISQKYLQQAPSGDLHHMASSLETKAHNDKPFFFAAVRLGVIAAGRHTDMYLSALAIFLNLFQHGGRPLKRVTEEDYTGNLSQGETADFFLSGITYRSGFLVNSAELAGFVHVPPAEILQSRLPPLAILKPLSLPSPALREGSPIGRSTHAGSDYRVCIPAGLRARSVHILGKPGFAKSTTIAHMILDDIDKGMGVAVIDPHGDLVEDLLCLAPKRHVERTIYFDPGYPDYVPIWNPLKTAPGQDVGRTADDIVGGIRSVVTGWGDRLEHLLRNGLYGLLQVPQSTFLDLSDLLRRKTEASERLRKRILQVVDNESAREFWQNDFHHYSNEALDPPKHKLSKLLVSGTLSLIFSQPESFFDFRRIMDEGMILLINLSTVGSEVRDIMGCFILSLFHLAALGRVDTPKEKRRQFHIYADEAHRFVTGAIEDLIVETRKFGVSLTLAHHYLRQFSVDKVDALSSVGTTIIMNVDGRDARYLKKDLRNLTQSEDLMNLEVGEAIARIGTEIVRFRNLGPLQIPARNFKDEIIERSLKCYYRPVHVIRDLIAQRHRRWEQPFTPLTTPPAEESEAFAYDEF